MSSGTSTESARIKPDTTTVPRKPDPGLQPWQFFVLAALGCATAATFIARGQGVIPILLLGVLMASTALVGIAALRAVRPLVSPEDDRTSMIGHRTRAALEREKMLALRSIKELEFDRAMGKLSDADWHEMSGRLRARAGRLMRQLDAGIGYRQQIERDLAKRLAQAAPGPQDPAYVRRADPAAPGAQDPAYVRRGDPAAPGAQDPAYVRRADPAAPGAQDPAYVRRADPVGPPTLPTCAKCATANDLDARFCKNCGEKL